MLEANEREAILRHVYYAWRLPGYHTYPDYFNYYSILLKALSNIYVIPFDYYSITVLVFNSFRYFILIVAWFYRVTVILSLILFYRHPWVS
jgi:hypothetical protein